MVVVELMDGAGQIIHVPVGQKVLGRGDDLGNSDKRLSRKQVVLEVEESGDVYITVHGVNPTYMTKKGSENPKMLKKDKKYPVGNGDHFCLLTTNYPYTVRIKNNNTNTSNTTNNPAKPISPQKPQKTQPPPQHDSEEESEQKTNTNNNASSKKRKIDEDSDDEGWGAGSGDETTQKNNNAKMAAKLGKNVGGGGGGEGNVQNKPVCQYGSACYRKNPTHWEQFFHPGDKKMKPDSHKGSSQSHSQSQSEEDELVVIGSPNDSQKSPPKPNKSQPDKSAQQQNAKKTVNFEDFKKGTKPPQMMTKSTPSSSSSKSTKDENENKNENKNKNEKENKAPSGEWSFAFPLVSSSPLQGQFDVQKAVEIAAEVIKDFLEKHDNFSLSLNVVVEADRLNTVSKLFQKNGLSDQQIRVTDSPIIETGAKVIAIESTWRLKPEPRNRVVYSAAECLEQEVKKRYPATGKAGGAYPVPLPPQTPLTHSGINWVMLCVGPNMNPNKTDYIDSYDVGSPLLKKTFESMLQSMYEIAIGKHDY